MTADAKNFCCLALRDMVFSEQLHHPCLFGLHRHLCLMELCGDFIGQFKLHVQPFWHELSSLCRIDSGERIEFKGISVTRKVNMREGDAGSFSFQRLSPFPPLAKGGKGDLP